MYQNIFCNKKDETIYIWDDEKGCITYPMSAFHYAFKKQQGGKYKSIFGDELTKVLNFDEDDRDLFESDIPIETKALVNLYENSDEISKGAKIGFIDIETSSEGGYPIVEEGNKEITAISVYDSCTCSCYTFVLDKNNELQDEETEIEGWIDPKSSEKTKMIRRVFDDEETMLMCFMDKWQEWSFTIITGWNVNYFDLPYLYNRAKRIIGSKGAKCLSPIGICYMNSWNRKMIIAGISVLDYLELYKKCSNKMEANYTLGGIGKKVVGIDKVHYDGTLNDLYKNDINKFVEYNIHDVKIVVCIDKKLQYIDLVRRICHTGHVPYDWFQMSSRYLDGAILLFLRRNGGLIAPNKPVGGREEYEEKEEEDEEGFSGAYVKEPVPGRYEWIFDLDLTSMYPNIIISLNISPETKVSKVDSVKWVDKPEVIESRKKVLLEENESATNPLKNNVKKKLDDGTIVYVNELDNWIKSNFYKFDTSFYVSNKIQTFNLGSVPYSIDEFKDLVNNHKYSVASNGCLYKTDKQGVIPQILSKWFEERQEMRKKARECESKGDKEGHFFNDQRQKVWKILLNSMYGVLGLPIFRFYDIDNAEAVTKTGVSIIKSTAKIINDYYKKSLGVNDGDWVIYTDTDSCFVAAAPIIQKRFPNIDFKNEKDMTDSIMSVTTEVQSYVNRFYDVMSSRFFNLKENRFKLKRGISSGIKQTLDIHDKSNPISSKWIDTTHTFEAKQEVISKTAFWLAKKRYAQWIIHEEGKLREKPRLDIKGIDVVRSAFPLKFREFMSKFIENMLTNSPKSELDESILKFKQEMKSVNPIELAKNTSVKFVSKDGTKNFNPEDRRPFQVIKGSTAQVKAALFYNDLLDKWELSNQYEKIFHAQKIKWVYLKDNEFGAEKIAIKADDTDPKQILEFVNKFIDRTAMFEKELKSKLMDFYVASKWEFPDETKKTAEQFFNF